MIYPFGDPVTLHSRTVTGQDTYGNDVLTDVTSTTVGAFAPTGSTELIQGQDTVITQPSVYLPAGTDVTALDRVTIRGVTYDVDGTPQDWRHPVTGWQPGIVVRLQNVTG